MSFFSSSRSKHHYPRHNYGSRHYQRSDMPHGLLGKILYLLMGRKHHSHSSSYHRGHHRRYRKKSSLWS